ncbi:YfiR family protein [Fulvivirgaceae bacterium BMA12]|uniref:YfiR family protein n=1 Tax=Agaribacillus aureus TaxID=3051825 RepID=A0ABT8L7V2_9BACT|nr:YfiR family protein [Fulvivirgaceae bacterium BMA12]
MKGFRFFKIVVVFLCVFALSNQRTQAQTDINSAYSLFLYNFAKYSQWPDNSSGDFKITVFGNSKVYQELQKISTSKKINGRNIVVSKAMSVGDIGESDLLFISLGKSGEISSIMETTTGKPIMVVAEKKGLYEKGACISFYVGDDSKLRFQINDQELSNRNLKMAQSLKGMAFKG